MFAVIYLVKYAANSRVLTKEHFADGFINTLFLLTTLTFSYYLSDRRSILTKEEFKAVRKKSILIVFLSVCTVALGVSIIGNILLHTEIKWLKLIEISLGLSTFSILFVIIMTKLISIKITPKTNEGV